jgi:hypothetical protein
MQVFAAYESQEFAIEKWCRCMKSILLCLDKAAIELLLPLVTLIGTWEALWLMDVARDAVRCGDLLKDDSPAPCYACIIAEQSLVHMP